MGKGQSQNLEGPALVTLGCHWLPLVTTHLVDDNYKTGDNMHINHAFEDISY